MAAYRDALTVDDAATEPELAQAAEALRRCDATVVLNGMVGLRPARHEIVCEVFDPAPASHRCAEEYRVLVENAGRRLERSRLRRLLPDRPLRWRVVNDTGTELVEVWRED